jgi:F-type H+-transporting ATPase subunit delta
MSNLVAKRYVKALMDGKELDAVAAVMGELREIASAYASEKFLSIISSTEVTSDAKVELLTSFVENCSDTTKNLVKLLAEKKRLDILADIAEELEKEVAMMKNSYEGVVYTNSELGNDYIASLEDKFSNKFGIELKLVQNICDYDGIKVDIDGLGVEIGFSKDRLKTQMIDHILKAV